MLVDVLGRTLKAGDFVLYARKNSEKVLNYGLVVSEKSIFDGKMNYSFGNECYLITNLDEKEKLLYEDLYSKYAKMLHEKQKKKQERQSNKLTFKAQKPFHIYANSKGYYLYLGKMRYNPEFTKDLNYIYRGSNYCSSFGASSNKEGYAYLELYPMNNEKLKAILESGEIDLSSYLYEYSRYYNQFAYKLSHYRGYFNVDLLKTFKSVYEDLGEFKVNGFTDDNKIFAYDLIHKKEISPVFDKESSNYKVAHLCWLEYME